MIRTNAYSTQKVSSGIEATSNPASVAVEQPGTSTERLDVRRQAVFVTLTFFGMIGGLLGSWFGAPSSLVWGFYAVAYVFGGWYGLKGSIAALREPAVEIDLLMIIAALGALYIGAPFEGAMLLFLFSLSGVLEEYAISRLIHMVERV